jgi:hypothetical protein
VTRRPDPLASPDGHPEPERRDLIGARLLVGDPSQYRPFSPAHRVQCDRESERSCANVTTVSTEGMETEVAVILGVDTHLDFHVAVAIDHLGRRLGEASVPTTPKGYERLLRWTEGFGSLRCAGVEGTSSYGAGLARHLRSRGSRCWKWSAPSTGGEARGAISKSPIPPTPKPPPERFWPEKPRACPRAHTGAWR